MIAKNSNEMIKKQQKIFDQEYGKSTSKDSGKFLYSREATKKHITQFMRWYVPLWSEVLDIGCGDGFFTKQLKYTNKIVAIDVSKEAIKKAKQNNYDKKIKYVQTPFEQFKTKQKFGAILAIDTFEHVYDGDKFLRKCNKLLKKEGHLIIVTPNKNRRTRRWFNRPMIESHHKEYTLASIKRMLKKHNFKILDIEHWMFIDSKLLPNIKLLHKFNIFLGSIFPKGSSTMFIVAEKLR